jgi:hypothetical protein
MQKLHGDRGSIRLCSTLPISHRLYPVLAPHPFEDVERSIRHYQVDAQTPVLKSYPTLRGICPMLDQMGTVPKSVGAPRARAMTVVLVSVSKDTDYRTSFENMLILWFPICKV